ncbi:GtrA family protein [Thiohalophilus sp.]|uniref:GtrA family protein n=1 Tax=Thiohalophilus sp. TaxID=3028392 RepID=UPI002ACD7110|nr:GtrA family protein [Thiohalophilus sp.]MDZ7802586.1 GtrA family protein [Thiohalophilus sp.]
MFARIIRSTSRRSTFARFTMVAGSIALIDIGLLYGLHEGAGVDIFISRLFSYLAAMTAGYFLNRHFTFHQHERFRTILHDLGRFYVVFSGGGLLNYGVFALVVMLGRQAGLKPGVDFWLPLLGVWLGGMVGMGFNFFVSHKLVFDDQ